MRRCSTCRDEANDILWQPFGPAETPTERGAFTWAGGHTRGFPALPLCATCQWLLRAGVRLYFYYKRQLWRCEGTTLTRDTEEDIPC